MRFAYTTAVLSVCPDLTDPDARSVPVATLLVGDLGDDDERLAAAAVLQPAAEVEMDPFLREHLTDALAIIRERVDHFWEERPGSSVQEILDNVHHALRNSLHVSEIGAVQNAELNETEALEGQLYGLVQGHLMNSLERFRNDIAPRPQPQPQLPRQRRRLADSRFAAWPLSPQEAAS